MPYGQIEQKDQTKAVDLDKDPSKVAIYKYIGESARSCYERGGEHIYDCKQILPKSHILKHTIQHHEGEDYESVSFLMKAIKFHKSSYERQIHESVMIQNNRKHHLLNSKSEFNRYALQRITIKMGEKELKGIEKEIEEERKIEEEIEVKI